MAQRIIPLVLFHDRPLSSNPTVDKDTADSSPSSQLSLSTYGGGSRARTTTRSIADGGMDIDVDPDSDMQIDPKVSESRDPTKDSSSSNTQLSSASNDNAPSLNTDLQVLGTSKPTTTSDSADAHSSTASGKTSPGPVDIVLKRSSAIQDEPTSTSMAVSPPSSSSSSSSSGLMMDTLAKSLSPARVDMHRKRIERMLQQNALMWWELVRYTRTLERKERELEQDREQFRPPGTPMGWGKRKIVHHYHHHHHHHHPSMPPLHPQQQQSLASSSTSTLSSKKFKIKSGRGGGRPYPYEYPMANNDRAQPTHPLSSPHGPHQQLHQATPQTLPLPARENEHGRLAGDPRTDPIIARPVPVKPSTFAHPSLAGPPVSVPAPSSPATATHLRIQVSNTKPPPESTPQPPGISDSPSATVPAQPEDEACNHQGGDGGNAHPEDQCPNSGSVDPNRKRRGNLPKSVTAVLKAWLVQNAIHPYPTEDQKQQLSEATNLSLNQISNWFINARRRILQPILVQAAAEAVAGTDAPMDNVLIVRKGKGSRMQVEMEGTIAQASSSSVGAGSSVGAASASSPGANVGSSSTDVKPQQPQRLTPPAVGHSVSQSNSLREERRPVARSPSYREQGYSHSPHSRPESPLHHPRTHAEHPGHMYHQHQHQHQHRQPQQYPHQHSQEHYYHERAHHVHQAHQAHLEHDHRPYHRQQQQHQHQPHIHTPYPHSQHSYQTPQLPQQHSSQRASQHQRNPQLSPHSHSYYPSQSQTRSPSPSHPPHSSSKVPAPA